LPFTRQQFLAVFASYNEAIWPAQVVAYLLGALVVGLLLRQGRASAKIIAGVLSLMWLWTGIAYHGLYFAEINPAALLFGPMFVLQGLFFIRLSLGRPRLRFGYVAYGPLTAGLA
jgi:hypothetical protein